MVIGSIWYGPLFGKMFIRLTGMDKMSEADKAAMKSKMMWSYLGQFIASLVTFGILACLINGLGRGTLSGGVYVALLVWIGFIVPLHFGNAIWGGKMKLFWLGVGNSLITMLVGGAILGLWR